MATPQQWRQSQRRIMDRIGEPVVLRRLGSPDQDFAVPAALLADGGSLGEQEMPGAVQQLRRKAFVLAEDLEAVAFPLPFLPNQDRFLWNGKTLVIAVVDDASGRVGGLQVSYTFLLMGA